MTTQAAACSQCGLAVEPGAKFCPHCGHNTGVGHAEATRQMAPASATQMMHDQLLAKLREATLGEYEILTELGRGGMATVYLGHEIQLARKVAIKVMLPSLLEGEGMVDRFKLEARTAAQMSHPHIIPIYAVREWEDLLFFVMKFVEGRPLDSIVKEYGALPPRMVQSIISKVGDALGYAHRRGVVHRDIKPANLMIDVEGLPVVTDFGIAKVTESRGLTMTGATVGTPHYMSPEQCTAGKITGSSDQYSLGVVAYEMLCGRLPFQGDSIVSLLYKHVHESPPSFKDTHPDVPQNVHDAVMKMLAKDPADRFATMEAAVEAIGSVTLSFDDPHRLRLMDIAKQGVNPLILKRISTPISQTPVRSRTLKKTGVPGRTAAGGAVDAAAQTVRTTPTPALGVKTAESKRGAKALVWGGAGVGVVAVGLGLWLKPWARPAPPPVPPVAATPVRSLGLEPAAAALDVGATLQITALPRDSANQNVTAAVTWNSIDPAVATVSGTGLVTGLAPGNARIIVSAGTVQNVAQVSVNAPLPAAPTGSAAGPVARIVIQGAPPTLAVGGTAQLRGVTLDSRGGQANDRSVSWSSSAPGVATVSRTGLVTAVSAGTAVISANNGAIRQPVTLTISAPTVVTPPPVTTQQQTVRPAAVAVSAAAPLTVGTATRLTATVTGDDGRPMSVPVSWRSSNPAVATVSEGNVSAVSAGTAVITASVEGREGSTTVTVSAPAAPPVTPPVTEANPRDAIAAVIQEYARALESRSVSDIRRVYPSMTSEQENQVSQTMRSLDQLQVRLRIGSLDVQGDVGNATVSGEYEFYSRENRRTERLPVRFQASFERGPSGWRIRSIR